MCLWNIQIEANPAQQWLYRNDRPTPFHHGPYSTRRFPLYATLLHRQQSQILTILIDESVDIAIWSTVEPAIGIVAACVITFRPLLRRILSNSSWGSHSKHTSRSPFEKRSRSLTTQTRVTTSRSYALSQSMPTLRPDYVGNYTEITSAGTHLNASPKEVIGAFNSDTELVPMKYQGPGISKEVRVTFTETDMDFEEEVNARWFEIKESRPQANGPVMVRPSVSHGKLQKPQHHR
jgi:hypothetical protein